MKTPEMTECCVCYEDKQVYYSCGCCKEGKICGDCCISIHNNCDDAKEYIKCPVCRSYNWKFLYDNLVNILDDFFEMICRPSWKPVYEICYRNNGTNDEYFDNNGNNDDNNKSLFSFFNH